MQNMKNRRRKLGADIAKPVKMRYKKANESRFGFYSGVPAGHSAEEQEDFHEFV